MRLRRSTLAFMGLADALVVLVIGDDVQTLIDEHCFPRLVHRPSVLPVNDAAPELGRSANAPLNRQPRSRLAEDDGWSPKS